MKKEVIWQTRDEMPTPTNPLQRLRETFAFTSRNCSDDKMIAFMYAIVMGWDDASYVDLKAQHNWTDEDVRLQKLWHENYEKAWNLFMETDTSAIQFADWISKQNKVDYFIGKEGTQWIVSDIGSDTISTEQLYNIFLEDIKNGK